MTAPSGNMPAVQIDAAKLDLYLIDANGRANGRPILETAIDCTSGRIVWTRVRPTNRSKCA